MFCRLNRSATKSECAIKNKQAVENFCTKRCKSDPSFSEVKKRKFGQSKKNSGQSAKGSECSCKGRTTTTSTTELASQNDMKCCVHKNTSTSSISCCKCDKQLNPIFIAQAPSCCPPNCCVMECSNCCPTNSQNENIQASPCCSFCQGEKGSCCKKPEILWSHNESCFYNNEGQCPQLCMPGYPKCQDPLLPFDNIKANVACCQVEHMSNYNDSYRCRPVPLPPKTVSQPWVTSKDSCNMMSMPCQYMPSDCYCSQEPCLPTCSPLCMLSCTTSCPTPCPPCSSCAPCSPCPPSSTCAPCSTLDPCATCPAPEPTACENEPPIECPPPIPPTTMMYPFQCCNTTTDPQIMTLTGTETLGQIAFQQIQPYYQPFTSTCLP